jgi:acetylornithine deacetylase/succinyl-diaminopimelate desuccinylase-like protein
MTITAVYLLAGFVPQRTLLFGFGHDEEVGGSKHAAHRLISTLLFDCAMWLPAGFTPQRTLAFGFGHDEEVDGSKGPAAHTQL